VAGIRGANVPTYRSGLPDLPLYNVPKCEKYTKIATKIT
jgi:hypothetical protein